MEETRQRVRPQKKESPVGRLPLQRFATTYYVSISPRRLSWIWTRAADLHGNSGVYLMYQHARASKLLEGISEEDINKIPAVFPEKLLLEAERALVPPDSRIGLTHWSRLLRRLISLS